LKRDGAGAGKRGAMRGEHCDKISDSTVVGTIACKVLNSYIDTKQHVELQLGGSNPRTATYTTLHLQQIALFQKMPEENEAHSKKHHKKKHGSTRRHHHTHPKHTKSSHPHSQQNQQDRQLAMANAGFTAVGIAIGWGTLKASIRFFHLARRRMLRELLFDTSIALTSTQFTHWLDFGALLGIHRDQDLILYDNDIDFAVLSPDWQLLEQKLKKTLPQYSVAIVVPSEDPTTKFMRVYCMLGMADIFGAFPIGDSNSGGVGNSKILVDCGHGDCTAVQSDIVLPPTTMQWKGREISVPSNLPAMLESRYGLDWKTPRYMDKGTDEVEGRKLYARIFRGLSTLGIRL